MGAVQSFLQVAWVNFFTIFGFMCSSDFVVQATPVLTTLFFIYRIFGPKDQGVSFGQSRVAELEHKELVNERSYGGGTLAATSPLMKTVEKEKKL